ncbi:unnamed protein product [Gordionus sp. m RMFG-2023]
MLRLVYIMYKRRAILNPKRLCEKNDSINLSVHDLSTKDILFYISLQKRSNFIRPKLEISYLPNLKNLTSTFIWDSCVFIGTIAGCDHCSVALTIYIKMIIIITTSNDIITIKRANPDKISKLYPSKFGKMLNSSSWNVYLMEANDSAALKQLTRLKKVIKRREINAGVTPLTIEIAIFMDVYDFRMYHFYKNKDKATEYILITMNMVEALFNHPTLGVDITFSIIKIYFMTDCLESLGTIGLWTEYLSKFCIYQALMNNKTNEKIWDLAILYTGIDVWSNSSVLVTGGAYVKNMCTSRGACAIVEGGLHMGYGIHVAAAHEIGHCLGLVHDHDLGIKECKTGNFIMDPGAGPFLYWSLCSKEDIKKYAPDYDCIHKVKKTNSFDFSGFSQPGTSRSLDLQCQAKFGVGSYYMRDTMSESCENLACAIVTTNSAYYKFAGTALEGSYCGENGWCVKRNCVDWPKSFKPNIVDGQWSALIPYAKCQQSCYPTGPNYETWIKSCNKPTTNFGGKPCVGGESNPILKYFVECSGPVVNKCEKEITLDDISPEFCSEAKRARTFTTSKRKYDFNRCILYCDYEKGSSSYPLMKLPDGVPCAEDEPKICINGVCSSIIKIQDLPPKRGKMSDFVSSGFIITNFNQAVLVYPPLPPNYLLDKKPEKKDDNIILPAIGIYKNTIRLYILVGNLIWISIFAVILGYVLFTKRQQDATLYPEYYTNCWNWWRYSNPYRPQSQTEDPATSNIDPLYNYATYEMNSMNDSTNEYSNYDPYSPERNDEYQ